LDARHLPQRVHARVGASGTVHRHGTAFEPCERILEQALHGVAFGLALPANEPRAVVREGELQSAHERRTNAVEARLAYAREPGLIAVEPPAQSGQASG